MHRHTERFVAWYDPTAARGCRWKVIDLRTADSATFSGCQELAGVTNYETAHSIAMGLEAGDDERPSGFVPAV